MVILHSYKKNLSLVLGLLIHHHARRHHQVEGGGMFPYRMWYTLTPVVSYNINISLSNLLIN